MSKAIFTKGFIYQMVTAGLSAYVIWLLINPYFDAAAAGSFSALVGFAIGRLAAAIKGWK